MTYTPARLANDRFKARSARSTWGGLIVAALLHFALFAFMPSMGVADVGTTPDVMTGVEMPPEVPQPPDPTIPRPPNPQLLFGDVDPVEPLPEFPSFDDYRDVPPPPAAAGAAEEEAIVYMPRDVNPSLLNTDAVQRQLERRYPPTLRDAGIGGRVDVWFYIDEHGVVQDARLVQPSAYPALDAVALEVASTMRFRPAQFRGRNVPVWVALPIVFTAK